MFKGIEGARGWLALAVLFSHIIGLTSFWRLPHSALLQKPGDWAVLMFIIISGFVITNLVTRKRETYGIYIARRALRIVPAYLVALALGVAILPLAFGLSGFGDVGSSQAAHFHNQAISYARAPLVHLVLHLSLLHGAVPNNLLSEAQYMFVPPAWSLSLEWQFYLVAPFVLWYASRRPALFALCVVVLYVVYRRGYFGHFYNPSLIFGAGWWFLVGIFSYFAIERLPRFSRYPWAFVVLTLPLYLFNTELVAVIGWLALIAYIRTDTDWWLLDSKLARFLGARSYSIYILHVPILIGCCWLSYSFLALVGFRAALVVAVLTTIATFAGAEIVYRAVERPAIAFGKRLGGSEPGPGSQGW